MFSWNTHVQEMMHWMKNYRYAIVDKSGCHIWTWRDWHNSVWCWHRYSRKSLKILGTVGEPINPEAWLWYHRVVGEEHCSIIDTFWQTETVIIETINAPICIVICQFQQKQLFTNLFFSNYLGESILFHCWLRIKCLDDIIKETISLWPRVVCTICLPKSQEFWTVENEITSLFCIVLLSSISLICKKLLGRPCFSLVVWKNRLSCRGCPMQRTENVSSLPSKFVGV